MSHAVTTSITQYVDHWYTWVIAGILLGILACLGYFKVIKPRWISPDSNNDDGANSGENGEKKSLLKSSLKKGNGKHDYGGIILYSTDMIPESGKGKNSGFRYQLQQGWRALMKQFWSNKKKNENEDNYREGSGDLADGLTSDTSDVNISISSGGMTSESIISSEDGIKVTIGTNMNMNSTSYESLHTMPITKSAVDKINDTALIKENEKMSTRSCNGSSINNSHGGSRLFRVKIEGHSPKKIPFSRRNKKMNAVIGRNNKVNYDSCDSGVYTDDLNSENDENISTSDDSYNSDILIDHDHDNDNNNESHDSYDDDHPMYL